MEKKCSSHRKLLIEKPHIVAWKCKYLRAMHQYRSQNHQKIYIDETWVGSNLTCNICWQSEMEIGILSNTNTSHPLIIVHAGSDNGFLQMHY